MRRLIYFSIIAILIFTSCGKDESTEPAVSGDLTDEIIVVTATDFYGTWKHQDSDNYASYGSTYLIEDEIYLNLGTNTITECGETHYSKDDVRIRTDQFDQMEDCLASEIKWTSASTFEDCDYKYKLTLSSNKQLLTVSSSHLGEDEYSDFTYTKYTGTTPCETITPVVIEEPTYNDDNLTISLSETSKSIDVYANDVLPANNIYQITNVSATSSQFEVTANNKTGEVTVTRITDVIGTYNIIVSYSYHEDHDGVNSTATTLTVDVTL